MNHIESQDNEERHAEEILVEADIKCWRNCTKGKLQVWPTSVCIYAKSSFWKARSLQAEFNNDTINSFKVEGNPAQALVLNIIEADGSKNETITINDTVSAQEILLALRKTCGLLDEKSRDERKQEEEEQQKKELERQRKQLDETYVQYVWSSAGAIHMVINSIYLIIAALSQEDWETAKGHLASLWRETDLLQEHGGFAISESLQNLRAAFEAGDGPNTTNSCASYVARLFDQCRNEKPTDHGWVDILMEKSLRPCRFQLSYWLLFETLYRETILDCGIQDWLLVDQALSKMRTLSPVLADGFGVKTADCIALLTEASTKRDSVLLIRHSGELEIRLGAASSSHWFREVKGP